MWHSPYAYLVEPFRPDRYHFECHLRMIRPVHHSLASIVACKSKLNIEKKEKRSMNNRILAKRIRYGRCLLPICVCVCLWMEWIWSWLLWWLRDLSILLLLWLWLSMTRISWSCYGGCFFFVFSSFIVSYCLNGMS